MIPTRGGAEIPNRLELSAMKCSPGLGGAVPGLRASADLSRCFPLSLTDLARDHNPGERSDHEAGGSTAGAGNPLGFSSDYVSGLLYVFLRDIDVIPLFAEKACALIGRDVELPFDVFGHCSPAAPW